MTKKLDWRAADVPIVTVTYVCLVPPRWHGQTPEWLLKVVRENLSGVSVWLGQRPLEPAVEVWRVIGMFGYDEVAFAFVYRDV